MSNMNSFFDELVEAKKAMELLPQLQSNLHREAGEHAVTRNRLDDAFTQNDALHHEIEQLKAALAEKEASLSAATFHASETEGKLNMLLGSFRSIVGEAGAAIELVDPPAPPVWYPVPTPAAVDTGSEFQASGEHGSSESNGKSAPLEHAPAAPVGTESNGGGESASDPIQAGSTTGTTTATDGSNATEGSVQPDPTQDNGSGQSSNSMTSMPTTPSTSDSGQRETDPTQAGSNTATGGGDSTESTSQSETAPSTKAEPTARPYWMKPDGVTWAAWIGLGNEHPAWVNADGTTKSGYGSF